MNTPTTIIHQANVLGHDLPIYGTVENPLFLAKDIAELIEHSNPSSMLATVDDDEKLVETMFISGQNRACCFLTEHGLYEVLTARPTVWLQLRQCPFPQNQQLGLF